MIKFLYTIFDTVLKEHSQPFMSNNDNHALILFDKAVAATRNAGLDIEFELYRIGSFDTASGHIAQAGMHELVSCVPKDPEKDLFNEE